MSAEYEVIEKNVQTVYENIAKAAEAAGKNPSEILLVAATKVNSAERVRMAVRAGIRCCGENRVQELLEKYEENAYTGSDLHFIGALQSNKVKYLIGKVSLIHSVSSMKLLETVNKEALKHRCVQDILLEVNIGNEESKSGFKPEELESAVEAASQMPGVCVKGLMSIPPIQQEPHGNLQYFCRMQQLFVDISSKKYDNVVMAYLSMGMSSDYVDAISCGANIVRIGTGIFGPRNYGKPMEHT